MGEHFSSSYRGIRSMSFAALVLAVVWCIGLSVSIAQAASLPTLVCHTGGLKWAPPDSMAAFRLSGENGIDLDANLQLSNDGVLVLIHDNDLSTGTNEGSGTVSGSNWFGYMENLTIKNIYGDYNAEQFADEKLARFEDLLSYMKDDDPIVTLRVEPKRHDATHHQAVLNAIQSYGLFGRVYVEVLSISEKNLVKGLVYGNQVQLQLWASSNSTLINEATNVTNRDDFEIIGVGNGGSAAAWINQIRSAGIAASVYNADGGTSEWTSISGLGLEYLYSDKPDKVLNYSDFNDIPAARISLPFHGDAFTDAETVVIQTHVGDSDASITKVEFYSNSINIGEDSSVPYTFSWSNPPVGTRVVMVRTFDQGKTKDSSTITITVTDSGSGNTPPSVDAGADQSITLPTDNVSLDGTVSDPDDTPTTTWTKVSGPGIVTFGDAGSVDTTATFSAAGAYVLRLTANDDTNAPVNDTMQVTVDPDPANDADGDGMPDWWEDAHGLDKNDGSDAGADPDSDGLTNFEEYQSGTDPQDPDTDDDGIDDGDDPDPIRAPAPFGGGCGGGTSVAMTLWLVLAIAGRRTRPSGPR